MYTLKVDMFLLTKSKYVGSLYHFKNVQGMEGKTNHLNWLDENEKETGKEPNHGKAFISKKRALMDVHCLLYIC